MGRGVLARPPRTGGDVNDRQVVAAQWWERRRAQNERVRVHIAQMDMEGTGLADYLRDGGLEAMPFDDVGPLVRYWHAHRGFRTEPRVATAGYWESCWLRLACQRFGEWRMAVYLGEPDPRPPYGAIYGLLPLQNAPKRPPPAS